MKNLTLTLALALVGATTISKAAPVRVLHTTKTGVPANAAPGLAGGTLTTAITKVHSSPDGNYYGVVLIGNDGASKRILAAGETQGFSSQALVISTTPAPVAPGFNWGNARSSGLGASNSGVIAASVATNEPSASNDYILRFQFGSTTPTVVAKEAAAFSGGIYLASTSPSPYAGGKTAFANGPGITNASQGIVIDGVLTSARGTLPVTSIGTADTITNHVAESYRMSGDGLTDMSTVSLGTDATKDAAVLVNGMTFARESYPIPNVFPAITPSALFGGASSSSVAEGGYYAYRGTEAVTTNEFAVIGKIGGTERIIRQSDPIATGETETWSSTSPAGISIQGVGVNKWGESVILGYSTRANSQQDFVVIYDNGFYSQVILREDQIIDINGNGILDDDAFMQSSLNDNLSISDSNEIFLSCTVVNGAGSGGVGAALHITYPIAADVDGDGEVGPGDFEQVVNQFGNPGTADIDRDGEVGPTDFEIVNAQFGRS